MPDNVKESQERGSANLFGGEHPGHALQSTFAQIYSSGAWTLIEEGMAGDDAESRSGLGSNLVQTATLRAELPALIAELGVSSILDVPCGDFFWMSRVDHLGAETYIGADIVPWLIERNRERYGRAGRDFRVIDLTRDPLPKVDLIFSRDCLVHLGDDDVQRALENIRRSGATFLATTTFTDRAENSDDIEAGGWRPLNLQRAPFALPEPFRLINERCTEVHRYEEDGVQIELRFPDKSIGVWRIADL
ncbi:class I SAM-dependent methyltransferase [Micromonospora sp. NPDC092111]|uniref:class I SAM-dependent methyltransferase n=1 Tax=Micromonospora sp. NPDC092111 TaxID=3364289 RepID=UPI003820ACDB